MSTTNKQAWKTKYGPRRVRVELPSLEEAIFAVQGLTDDLDQQAEIAASLMGLPQDEVRAELLKQSPGRGGPAKLNVAKSVVFAGPADAPRSVVVERKPSRRIAKPTDRAASAV